MSEQICLHIHNIGLYICAVHALNLHDVGAHNVIWQYTRVQRHTSIHHKKTENNTNLPLSVCFRIWKLEEAHWLACSWVNTCTTVVAAVDHTAETRPVCSYRNARHASCSQPRQNGAPNTYGKSRDRPKCRLSLLSYLSSVVSPALNRHDMHTVPWQVRNSVYSVI